MKRFLTVPLSLLVALVASFTVTPAPRADAGVLCHVAHLCGHLSVTAGSATYVTVTCDGGRRVRVYPGHHTPGSCDANYFTSPAHGHPMWQRILPHRARHAIYVRIQAGHRFHIFDGRRWYVRKH